MDRLHALTAFIALTCAATATIAGCDAKPPPPPSTSRVEAVSARGPDDEAIAGFCDVRAKPGHGAPFQLPPLAAPPSEEATGTRWVNVWATWCKPCVEELPMMAAWGPRLAAEGARASLVYVNVDAEAATVEKFRHAHPGTPESLSLQSADVLAPWLEALGLDPGAGLPVHAFVGADGRVRCVRAGGVTDDHYELVKAILADPSR